MNRRMTPALAAVLVVLVSACKEEIAVQLYEPVPVAQRDIIVSAEAAGTIEPILVVEVKSKASGEVMELNAETGDIVRQGDLLVRVDPRDPTNQVAQAQADLDVARAQLANAESAKRRADEMFDARVLSEQEHEQAGLTYANARAQLVRAERGLQTARDQLDDTNVRAPITGTIIQKNVERGQVIASATREVSGGTVLLQMADLSEVQVRTLVDETDIGKIQSGLAASITVDAYPNRPFQGTVLKIEPQSVTNQNVTMFPVLIRIPNEQGLLRPGMNAQVDISVSRRLGVLAIPNAALRTARDVGSAAAVLGLDPREVDATLARADSARGAQPNAAQGASAPAAGMAARRPPAPETSGSFAGRTPTGTQPRAAGPAPSAPAPMQMAGNPPAGGQRGGPGGFTLPDGVTREMLTEIRRKREAGEALTPAESTASARMREAFQRAGSAPGAPGTAGATAMPAAAPAGASASRLPAGVTEERARDIMRRGFTGGTLSAEERTVFNQMRSQMGGGGPGGASGGRRRFGAGNSFQFGGSYIVFVLRDGRPTPVRIRTGVTDMDYSEIVSGLAATDTVLLLPSASMVQSQTELRERFQRIAGGGVPGMSQTSGGSSGGGRRR